MSRIACVPILVGVMCVGLVRADVPSGPAIDEDVPELNVFGVIGEVQEEDVDYVTHRAAKPTVYCLIQDRSNGSGRFLDELDELIIEVDDAAAVVVVFLPNEDESTESIKNVCGRMQRTYDLEHMSLALWTSDSSGPPDWAIHPEAELTAVVAVDGQTKAVFGFTALHALDETMMTEKANQIIEAFE